jgi:hypothetical protein
MPLDKARDQIAECLNFFRLSGGRRQPPERVLNYVRFRKELPDLRTLVTKTSPLELLKQALSGAVPVT